MGQIGIRAAVVLAAAALAACTSHTSGNGTHSSGTSRTSSTPTPSDTSTVSTVPESLTPSVSDTASVSSPVLPQTSLVITRYGWNAATHVASAVAILPGKVIDQGSCTLTITLNGTTRTASKASTPDASSTDCGLLAITDATLTPGSWSGSVSFTGGGTTATSTSFTIEVTA